MTTKTKGRAGGQAAPKTSDTQEFTQKSDIDLQSWASLGANVKPSRFNRKKSVGGKGAIHEQHS